MPKEITESEARALAASGFWLTISPREIATFQMETWRLCMPFKIFHEALEKALGRPVFTHERGLNYEGLRQELRGERPTPSFADILNLIPREKRILVMLGD